MSETDPFYSEEAEGMSKRTQLEEFFSQSLEVELLLRLCPDDEDTIYQIVDLLVDTCATKRKMLHIAGDDKPAEVVRSRFMKLNADHIRFVLKCLAENSSPIRNMKQYLLASLYNAPTTMQLSYQNQTNHDLAIPELLDMVDEKKIAFNPAVELSYLDEAQQRDFLEAMNDTQNAPSLSQAQRLKKLVQEGHFSYDVAFAVMGEEKKDELDKVVIKNDTLRKYFPRSYTPKQMEDTIIKLLEQWQRKQQRQNER